MPETCTSCNHPLAEAVVDTRSGRKALVSTLSLTERCDKSDDRRHHVKKEATVPDPIQSVPQAAPQPDVLPSDVERMIEAKMKDVMEAMTSIGAGPVDFKDVLDNLDPADSDAALLMLDWLLQNARLHRVGVLDGGQGYLFVYQEPQGSTKEGYRPGATQGGRIVDDTLAAQRESGAQPRQKGLCQYCFSGVEVDEHGTVYNAATQETGCAKSPQGLHEVA